MNNTALRATMVALLSAGWLVPLYLGVSAYLEFWRVEAWPLLAGQQPMNSFPFLTFTRNCIAVSLAWLGLVLFSWSYVVSKAMLARSVHKP